MSTASRFHRIRNALRVLNRAGFPVAAYDPEVGVITGVPGYRLRPTRGRTDHLMKFIERQVDGLPEGDPVVVLLFERASTAATRAYAVVPYVEWVGLIARQEGSGAQ